MNVMKYRTKRFLQMTIFVFMLLMGFCFTYAIVWMQFGLPLVWWATVILFVLAGLSTIGLIRWIVKG